MSENRNWGTSNEFGGKADNAVQAGSIGGGVHFHAASKSEAEHHVEELSATLAATQRELALTQQQLAETRQELQRFCDFRAAATALAQVGPLDCESAYDKEHGIQSDSVDQFVIKLHESAKEGPVAVLQLLARPELRVEFYRPGLGFYYDAEGVENYLTRVRLAMVDVIRQQGL